MIRRLTYKVSRKIIIVFLRRLARRFGSGKRFFDRPTEPLPPVFRSKQQRIWNDMVSFHIVSFYFVNSLILLSIAS
jgi:hypothetical protein